MEGHSELLAAIGVGFTIMVAMLGIVMKWTYDSGQSQSKVCAAVKVLMDKVSELTGRVQKIEEKHKEEEIIARASELVEEQIKGD